MQALGLFSDREAQMGGGMGAVRDPGCCHRPCVWVGGPLLFTTQTRRARQTRGDIPAETL